MWVVSFIKLFCAFNACLAIHYMYHCQIIGERGVCEVTFISKNLLKLCVELLVIVLVVLVVYRCYAVILIENSLGEKWRSHSSNKCFIMKYVCYIHDLTVCLALLRKLLVENRSKRYTIRQIRDHQWFNKNFNRTALGI